MCDGFSVLYAPLALLSQHLFCAGIDECSGALKLQKEGNEAKESKKDKREKERKDKSKELHENLQHREYHHKKRKYNERGQLHKKDDHHKKRAKGAIEQLEKSSLTEENGVPYSIPNHYDSSDSTQDSGKGKKLVNPGVGHNNRGLVLRIKLPLKKQKNVELLSAHHQSCLLQTEPSQNHTDLLLRKPLLQKHTDLLLQKPLSQNHTDLLLQKPGESIPVSTSEPCPSNMNVETHQLQRHQCVELPASNEQPCFSGRIIEARDGTAGSHSKSEKRTRSRTEKMGKKFNELIVNWNHPPMPFEDSDIGDQDWLFRTNKKHVSAESCRNSIAEVPDHGSHMSSMQPRARFLPEFDTYEMPYVFPF